MQEQNINNIPTQMQQGQPQQMPQMPMQPPMPPRGGQRRQSVRSAVRRIQEVIPSWLSRYGAVTYLFALLVVGFVYSDYAMPWYYWVSGLVSVVVFFFYGSYLANDKLSIDRIHRQRNFEKKIFLIAFIPRVLWMFLIYYIFMENYGNAFGFENADALYYDTLGQFVKGLIEQGNFHFYDEIKKWSGQGDVSDMGYGVYVGFVYWLTDNSIIAIRLLKCVISAFTVLLVYRLARRNFEPQTARVAAILCALWPNFWYYCGTHLKETEMVFLCVLFVEQAEQMLRSRQFTAWKVIPVLLIGASILTFRTPLALVAFLSLIFSVVMSSTRVVTWGKRTIVGGLAIILIGVTMGNQIEEQSLQLLESARGDYQEKNMEWRANREEGNTFAKYAGKSVFAPLIFTIPFPTMVQPYAGQEQHQMQNGGNFIKNIISVFTLIALVMLLLNGKWRDHLLPLSFMLGYLVVLTMSTFAQSERFHQPVMPFEFMFAAYGLTIATTKPKYKRWFMYWCVVMFVGTIAWNWFKLAGRGLA